MQNCNKNLKQNFKVIVVKAKFYVFLNLFQKK